MTNVLSTSMSSRAASRLCSVHARSLHAPGHGALRGVSLQVLQGRLPTAGERVGPAVWLLDQSTYTIHGWLALVSDDGEVHAAALM